jgi:hypothetical protein
MEMEFGKRGLRLLSMLGLVAVGVHAQTVDGGIFVALPANQLTPDEAAAGYQLLWNGKDFQGWKTYGAPSPGTNWAIVAEKGIENGGTKSASPEANVLEVVNTGESIFTTDTTFADFDLLLEWQVPANKVANSGILFHYSESHGRSNNNSAPEYQICNSLFPEWTDSNTTAGANYEMHALLPSRRNRDYSPTWTRAAGHWNQSRIIAYKGRVAHYGNGLRLLEYKFGTPDWNARFKESKYGKCSSCSYYATWHPGSVFLQDHGEFYPKLRSIRIKKLTQDPWASNSPYLNKAAAAKGDSTLLDTLGFNLPLFGTATGAVPHFGIAPKQARIVESKEGVSILFAERGRYVVRLHDLKGGLSAMRTADGSGQFTLPAGNRPNILSIWNGNKKIQETLIGVR